MSCPIKEHRLYWAIEEDCPCMNQVEKDFLHIASEEESSEKISFRLYQAHPWLIDKWSKEQVRHIFLELLDMDAI